MSSTVSLIPPQLKNSWKEVLQEEWEQPYLKKLADFLQSERTKEAVYPPKSQVFSALEQTPFEKVQVVIVGQDPYHGPGQAHGLSFSVPQGITPPPSLKNIFRELHEDLQIKVPSHGNLEKWAKQGILLLNSVLTVRSNQPRSHHGEGWEYFTDAIIKKLVEREDPIIFVLWGRDAQLKCRLILGNPKNHFLLEAPHPSPFSAYSGFFGCRHFSKIQEMLKKQGKALIDWSIDE